MPYFDYNATTPLCKPAQEALTEALSQSWHNPSSPYRSAARVRNLLEEARQELAVLLQSKPEQVIFNSGATEGINAVMAHYTQSQQPGACLVSATEHPAVLEAAQVYFGKHVDTLPVDRNGQIELGALEARMKLSPAALCAVMAANNETGTLQPLPGVAEITAAHGLPLLCDASQYLGKMPVDAIRRLPGECWLIGCAHKFGGPNGTGFLVRPASVNGFRGQAGGGQEMGQRSGTENYPSIAAMLAAIKMTHQLMTEVDWLAKRQSATKVFLDHMENAFDQPLEVVARDDKHRLWNTIMMVMPRFGRMRWVTKLDKLGFQISTGSACATGKTGTSHVLSAMGYSNAEAQKAIRISSGWETTQADWLDLAKAIQLVWHTLCDEGETPLGSTRVIQI